MALPLWEEQGLFFCGCASRNTRLEYHKKRHFARVFLRERPWGTAPKPRRPKAVGRRPTTPAGDLVKASSLREDGFAAALSWRCSSPCTPIWQTHLHAFAGANLKRNRKTACKLEIPNFPLYKRSFLPKHVSPPLRRSENRSCALGFQGRNSLGGNLRAKPSRSFYSSSYSFSSFRARAASMRAKA